MATRQIKCRSCGGKGKVRCPKCHGTGEYGGQHCEVCRTLLSLVLIGEYGDIKCESCNGKGYWEEEYDDERSSRSYNDDEYTPSYSGSSYSSGSGSSSDESYFFIGCFAVIVFIGILGIMAVVGYLGESKQTSSEKSGSANISLSNLKIKSLRFFNTAEGEQRQYQNRFSVSEAASINWELGLVHDSPRQKVNLTIDFAYVSPSGNVINNTTQSYVEANWPDSFHSNKIGLNTIGNWFVGSYKVEMSVNGQKISRNFEIYDSDEADVSQPSQRPEAPRQNIEESDISGQNNRLPPPPRERKSIPPPKRDW